MFRERFLDFLDSKNTTYAELARQTGIPRTTISNWINRNYKPDVDKAIIVADYLGVTVEELFGTKEKLPKSNINFFENFNLTDEEKQLVRQYREMPATIKKEVQAMFDSYFKYTQQKNKFRDNLIG